MLAKMVAVIGREDDDRVVPVPISFERFQQQTDLCVDERDARVIGLIPLSLTNLSPLAICTEGMSFLSGMALQVDSTAIGRQVYPKRGPEITSLGDARQGIAIERIKDPF